MADSNSNSLGRLILIPGLITLGVTVLRLVGELQGWSNLLFNAAPGGGGGLVGIVWLIPVFGIYFALKLSCAEGRPASLGKTAGLTFVGLVLAAGGVTLFAAGRLQPLPVAGTVVLMLASIFISLKGWSSLAKTLLAYGYAARIPVTIIMFFAIRGDWGTHYDGPPPFAPPMRWLAEFFLTGFIPQLFFWVAFTVCAGSLFGIAAVATFGRKSAAAATA